MSKLVKFFAIAALIAGAFAMTPGPAAAQRHGGHGGGRLAMVAAAIGVVAVALARRLVARRRLGTRLRLWLWPGLGLGYPYWYYDDYYAGRRVAAGRACACWHNHHWVLRRAWRCW